MATVPTFASEHQFAGFLVKPRTPLNQFANVPRRLTNHEVHNLRFAQSSADGNRILDMVLELVFWIDDARNTTLCIGTSGLLNLLFRDQKNR